MIDLGEFSNPRWESVTCDGGQPTGNDVMVNFVRGGWGAGRGPGEEAFPILVQIKLGSAVA